MGMSRSENMSRIRAENTTAELILRAALEQVGLQGEAHGRTPVGRPDLVLESKRVAVFIDGCFWHGCPLHYVRPRTREAFWSAKLEENVGRDRRQTQGLCQAGWRVVRVWEHEVYEGLEQVVARVELASAGEGDEVPGWRVIRVDVVDPEIDLERRCMVDLSDPALEQVQVSRRSTKKWTRPKGWRESP